MCTDSFLDAPRCLLNKLLLLGSSLAVCFIFPLENSVLFYSLSSMCLSFLFLSRLLETGDHIFNLWKKTIKNVGFLGSPG